MTDNESRTAEERITEAIENRLATGVSSVSVDGMSTSYASLNDQLKALSELKKLQAAKTPLGCFKIFKVRSEG